MKFCILSIGTYGDVAPYVALGVKLKQEGHEVVIAAHEKARSVCERFLLGFHPIRGDLSVETSPSELAKQAFAQQRPSLVKRS